MFQPLIQRALPRRHRRANQRDGAAVVEAAFCIPVILIMMMGTLEVCSGLYLSESLTVCAYEATRAGVRRGKTADDVYDRAVEVLAQRNITLPTGGDGKLEGVVIEPGDFSSLKALDEIRVTITASTSGNSLYVFNTLFNRDISASCAMVREFDD